MNLKEKWSKQNNSIKLLLKKLKRHDTLVVGIAVVIATAICGGLIYLSTPVVTATAKEELRQDEIASNEKTVEKLDELKEYLDGIDKTVAENQKSLSVYSEKSSENHKEAGELTERMTSSVTEKVVGLDKDMKDLRQLISNTESAIDTLKSSMEKGSSDNKAQVDKEIGNLYVELEKIENKYNETKENTRNLMGEIRTAVQSGNKDLTDKMQDQYKDLLARLEETDARLTEQNTTSMADFKTEIGAISNTINNNFAKIDSTINSGMGNVNNEIIGVKGDLSELKSYIGLQMSDVNKNLETVFTFVSDGKKKVASALLTKGIKVREDATFDEIAAAVMNIETEYVLPENEIPGEVEYTYHYHTDATGDECNENLVGEDRKGGCYTKDIHHVHTDSCYKTQIVYHYETADSTTMLSYEGDYYNGKAFYKYRCNYCGAVYVTTGRSHGETSTSLAEVAARHGTLTGSEERKTKICKYADGELEGYATSCGYVHGQVVGAKIRFSGNGVDYETVTGNGNSGSSAPIETSLMRTTGFRNFNADSDLFDFTEGPEKEPAPSGNAAVTESSSAGADASFPGDLDNGVKDEKGGNDGKDIDAESKGGSADSDPGNTEGDGAPDAAQQGTSQEATSEDAPEETTEGQG